MSSRQTPSLFRLFKVAKLIRFRGVWLRTLGVVLVAALALIALHRFELDLIQTEAKYTAHQMLERQTLEISNALAKKFAVTNALEAFVTSNPQISTSTFQAFAASLESIHSGLMSVQLAPQGIVTYVSQIERNRQAIGHDLLKGANARESAIRAAEAGQLIVVGPVNLLQGGRAIIARKPIMIRSPGETPEFWGFATVLIDFDVLSAKLGIAEMQNLAIRSVKENGESGAVLFGTEETFTSAQASESVQLGNATWRFALNGVQTDPSGIVWLLASHHFYWLLALLLTAIAVIALRIFSQPYLLQRKVDRAMFNIGFMSTHSKQVFWHRNLLDGSKPVYTGAIRQIYGAESAQNVNLAHDEIIHPEDRPVYQVFMQNLLQLPATPFEATAELSDLIISDASILTPPLRTVHPDGSTHWIEIRGTRYKIGDELYIAGVTTDIDSRRQQEQQLIEKEQSAVELAMHLANSLTSVREAKRQAEDARQELTKALGAKEALVEDLNELSEKRNRLFGMVAHELRTPVAAIAMLSNEYEGAEFERQRGQIKRFTRDLLHTIDEMRLLINPDLKRSIVDEEFDVRDLNMTISSSVASTVSSTGVRYQQFNALPQVLMSELFKADTYRVKVAVTNLVRNAALHSEGTEVWMASGVYIDAKGERFLEWLVGDNGKGIALDQVQSLFEPGVRGDTKADGTGLGLHIARSWIEEIGGTLTYRPAPVKGSQFVVRVPLIVTDQNNSSVEQCQSKMEGSAVLSNLRVLLVEDDQVLRMVGKQMLSSLVASVDVAEDGFKGIEKYLTKPEQYDLIMTDYFMPNLSGVDLCRRIRAKDQKVPIIGVTAATIGNQIDELKSAGADLILPKPLNSEQFSQAVAELVVAGRLEGLCTTH